jgi:DegV family protein with EDD domain
MSKAVVAKSGIPKRVDLVFSCKNCVYHAKLNNMTIAIVTDSTSDLTPELCTQYNIKVVPLQVLFDGKMYKDGLELTPKDIFQGVKEGKKLPSTSQPSPAEFAAVYREALRKADQVLSIHLSSQLSGTVSSARLAAQDFSDKVVVVDSRSATMGLGMQVLRAAKRAQEGNDLSAITEELGRVRMQASIRFTVDTLDFLRINGRIGGAQALLGSLLHIKPILTLKDGRVEAAGRVRGNKKAIADLIEHIKNYIKQFGNVRAALMYTAGGESYIQEVRSGLDQVSFEDLGSYLVGTAVATHAGPGIIGVAIEPVTV